MKKLIRLSLLVVVIAGGLFAYCHFSMNKENVVVDHLRLVSKDASAILQFHDEHEFNVGLETFSMVSGLSCDLATLKQILPLIKNDNFKKGSLAIFECNPPNRLEFIIETNGSKGNKIIEDWSLVEQRDFNVMKYIFPSDQISISEGIILSDKESAYLVGEEGLRMIVVHENASWLERNSNRIFSENVKYSIHEISRHDQRIHLKGFSIPHQFQASSTTSQIKRTFDTLIPNSFESFSWNQILDQNEWGAMESVQIELSDRKKIYAMRLDMNQEATVNLTNSSSGLISELDKNHSFQTFFHEPEPNLKYFSLLKDWIICATEESALIDFGHDVKTSNMWLGSEKYNDFLNFLSIDATSISYSIQDKRQLITQFSGKENDARYHVVDIVDKNDLSIATAHNEIQKEKYYSISDKYPFEFINHYTGEKEWLIQDDDLNLVLMSKNKEVIFKRKLNEEVMGEFKMVDALRNNKYQIVFNTASHIYIIDRKGRDLENFPVKLPYEASNELSVVDYDNKGNYRLFVGLENGMVLNYTIGGKKVKGWKYTGSDVPIIYPITHLRLGNKDYLFALNEDYEIQLLNRKGQIRHPLDSQPEGLKNMAFEIFQKDNIQNSGIRYSNPHGESVDFLFGKTES